MTTPALDLAGAEFAKEVASGNIEGYPFGVISIWVTDLLNLWGIL